MKVCGVEEPLILLEEERYGMPPAVVGHGEGQSMTRIRSVAKKLNDSVKEG